MWDDQLMASAGSGWRALVRSCIGATWAAVILAVVLAACGGPGGRPTTAGGNTLGTLASRQLPVAPWRGIPADSDYAAAMPVADTAAVCSAPDLSATTFSPGYSMGSTTDRFQLQNISASACELTGQPFITQATTNRQATVSCCDTGALPAVTAVVLPPGMAGVFFVQGDPGEADSCAHPSPSGTPFIVEIAGGGSLHLNAAGAICGVFNISAMGAEEGHPLKMDPGLTALAPALVPAAQQNASTATATLELTNRKSSSVYIQGGSCPNIAASVGSARPIEYQLNCAGANRPVPPGDTQPFLIQFPLPSHSAGPITINVWIFGAQLTTTIETRPGRLKP